MDYGEMIRRLMALSSPRFNLSTSDRGQYGSVQGGVDVPLDQNSQLFARGQVAPTNMATPTRNADFGAMLGFRQQF